MCWVLCNNIIYGSWNPNNKNIYIEQNILTEGITIVFFHPSSFLPFVAEKNKLQDRAVNLSSSTLNNICGCAAG